jgi:hypothetical protein
VSQCAAEGTPATPNPLLIRPVFAAAYILGCCYLLSLKCRPAPFPVPLPPTDTLPLLRYTLVSLLPPIPFIDCAPLTGTRLTACPILPPCKPTPITPPPTANRAAKKRFDEEEDFKGRAREAVTRLRPVQ